jgi:hypothetical protein
MEQSTAKPLTASVAFSKLIATLKIHALAALIAY